jgi:hypothetical protein
MKRVIAMQSSTWWLPITGGLLVVLFLTTIVLRWGPQPAVAPGIINSSTALRTPLILNAAIKPVSGESRGWLEVKAGTVSLEVAATPGVTIKVLHWLTTEQAPVVDATVLKDAPAATQRPDGTWVESWTMKAGQTAHAAAYAVGYDDLIQQTDAFNIQAVR